MIVFMFPSCFISDTTADAFIHSYFDLGLEREDLGVIQFFLPPFASVYYEYTFTLYFFNLKSMFTWYHVVIRTVLKHF